MMYLRDIALVTKLLLLLLNYFHNYINYFLITGVYHSKSSDTMLLRHFHPSMCYVIKSCSYDRKMKTYVLTVLIKANVVQN